MSRTGNPGLVRSERLKRTLMICSALVLFVLGIWLLIEPKQAQGSELVDNVDANNSQSLMA